MLQRLHFQPELVVKSGFLYVPLLFDAEISAEVQRRSGRQALFEEEKPPEEVSEILIDLGGKLFVKSLDVYSLLANYDRIDKDYYEQLKENLLRQPCIHSNLEAIAPKGKLRTILLNIMPHFIRQRRGIERRRLNDDELLDLVRSRVDVPDKYTELADKVLDPGPLLQRLAELNQTGQIIAPLEEGLVSGEVLSRWMRAALEVQIVEREKALIERELARREELNASERKQIATLLYLSDRGSLELDGFGFSRIGSRDDYLIYKRTGEYILKDYYDRSYQFADCRVAVSTAGPLRPIVVEYYKHPFLLGHASEQEICLTDYDWPNEFTGDNVIRLLEDGINALLYGYDARRRNGYHSLDPTLYYVKTIEFGEYRV